MLSSLRIENIAIIEKADINFDIGLNVMTGETGAGKSIIIDSLNAVLGERTSKELIRTGATDASVTAFFVDIGENVIKALNELEISDEGDGTLLIQRKINADGRNTCKVNGCPVTVSMLKQLGKELINIHGQHDSHFLLSGDNHYAILDSFAQNGEILEKYREVFKKYISLKKELKKYQTDEDEREHKLDLMTFQFNELKRADIKVGEFEKLIEFRDKCLNSEKITESLHNAYNGINGDEDNGGVMVALKYIASELDGIVNNYPEISESAKKVKEVMFNLEEVSDSVRRGISSVDFNPIELEETEERIDFLLKLKRKYGESEQEMLDYMDKISDDLKNIEKSDERIDELTDELNECGERMLDLAEKLSQSRQVAGKEFTEKVKEELEYLDMPGVEITISRKDKPLNSKGKDDIEFFFSANAGESVKSLSKIASGGELSRIMLAIKNVTTADNGVGTMIFDEIDTGVSGKTAEKIGYKLASVADGRQVICVTHSAQIASQADRHLLIEKSTSNGHTYTQVRPLTNEGRKFELARIIGGVVITQGQLKVAEEMLKKGKHKSNGTEKNG